VGQDRGAIECAHDYKLLIFDWDGTLADSIGRIVEAMNVAAERAGEACSDDAVKGIIGLALPEAIRTLYPHLDAEQVSFSAALRRSLHGAGAAAFAAVRGVVESLEAFRAEGYHLAVATGKRVAGWIGCSRPMAGKIISISPAPPTKPQQAASADA
jgi:phosphoglycolate phosphatase